MDFDCFSDRGDPCFKDRSFAWLSSRFGFSKNAFERLNLSAGLFPRTLRVAYSCADLGTVGLSFNLAIVIGPLFCAQGGIASVLVAFLSPSGSQAG
jgi:hypothetical protein